MKKIVIIISVIVVAIGGFFIYKKVSKKAQPIEIETQKIGRATISNTVTATGTIEATTTVEVGTQVSGQISQIYVDNNSQVKKGQLIARLDEQALKSTLEQSQATLDQAQAEYDYQKSNLERYKKLMEKNLIAQQDFDEVDYNYKMAAASLKQAKASYDKNKTNLDYAYIYSPIDGIVLERAVEEGETVAASYSTPTLFTIANDLTQMEIEADVDEADIGQLKLGQRVEFTVDAFPDDKFNGEVTEIRLMPTESSNVITYTVIINAPNPDKKLMPGMTANVTFFVTEKKNILVVPAQALEFQPNMESLMTYCEEHPEIQMAHPDGPPHEMGDTNKPQMADLSAQSENAMPPMQMDNAHKMVWIKTATEIHPQMVSVGETDEINYEVLSGLAEGDEVIISVSSTNAATANGAMTSEGEARSPFMPSPPGANRKK